MGFSQSNQVVMRKPINKRFTLLGVFYSITSVAICIGVIATIEFAASIISDGWFGSAWRNTVTWFLIESLGFSDGFVGGYVTFALISVPSWICYCSILFLVGLFQARWTHRTGITILASIALFDFMSDSFFGRQFQLYLRLVSLSGVVLATVCFIAARKLRTRKASNPAIHSRRFPNVLLVVSLAALIGISAFGWWLIGLNHEVALEFRTLLEY